MINLKVVEVLAILDGNFSFTNYKKTQFCFFGACANKPERHVIYTEYSFCCWICKECFARGLASGGKIQEVEDE